MVSASAHSDHVPASGDRPTLVVAVAGPDVPMFPTSAFAIIEARGTAEAIYLITTWQPRLVAVAWDAAAFDAGRICAAARQIPDTAILATMAAPTDAPKALRAGCHDLLFKPLTACVVAARLGRLSRDGTPATVEPLPFEAGRAGAHRMCHDVCCPDCGRPGAVAFEHSSHRRVWYECSTCEWVWLGRRVLRMQI